MPPQRIWYGLDDIVDQETIIIVEGEALPVDLKLQPHNNKLQVLNCCFL